jgi:hypothetical protein
VEKLRYMHRNPVKCGLVLEPELWEWSSYRSYAFQEEGRVKINQWPAAVMKIRPAARPQGSAVWNAQPPLPPQDFGCALAAAGLTFGVMDLSKYPIQKLLFVAAGTIPGFVALLIYRAAAPHCFDWFLSLGSLGYRTKVGVVLLTSLPIGATVTRFVAGLIGGIEGAIGAVLSKPSHVVKVAPWRETIWRAALSKVLREPPKSTMLWPDWFYAQSLQAIALLPEDQRAMAGTQLELDRLANQSEDAEWNRWYRYYHNRILFPAERDFLFEVQRGIHFNLQAAAVYVLGSAWFVPAVRAWWCMLPACFWFIVLIGEEWIGSQNAVNLWSTLDRQITFLSELGRSSPASQGTIPFPANPPPPG